MATNSFPSPYFSGIIYNSNQFANVNGYVTLAYANNQYLARVGNPTSVALSTTFNGYLNVIGNIFAGNVLLADNHSSYYGASTSSYLRVFATGGTSYNDYYSNLAFRGTSITGTGASIKANLDSLGNLTLLTGNLILTAGSIINPTISGGNATNMILTTPTINNPTISGGNITGAIATDLFFGTFTTVPTFPTNSFGAISSNFNNLSELSFFSSNNVSTAGNVAFGFYKANLTNAGNQIGAFLNDGSLICGGNTIITGTTTINASAIGSSFNMNANVSFGSSVSTANFNNAGLYFGTLGAGYFGAGTGTINLNLGNLSILGANRGLICSGSGGFVNCSGNVVTGNLTFSNVATIEATYGANYASGNVFFTQVNSGTNYKKVIIRVHNFLANTATTTTATCTYVTPFVNASDGLIVSSSVLAGSGDGTSNTQFVYNSPVASSQSGFFIVQGS